MRINRGQIRARCKPLRVTYSEEQISAYGGLELLGRYLRGLGLAERVRRALRPWQLDGDYGAAQILLALVGLLVIGGWRVAHLAFVGTDPMLLRFCGLHRMPTDRTVVRWLKRFTPPALLALSDLIRDLVYAQIEGAKLRRVTIDVDGTVLRTGLAVEGTARGYNPHHPKDPSYYPLTAHVAQLGQILRVWNRPGNVNDAHNAAGFLRGVVRELRERFGRRLRLELRMDGAFFVPSVFRFLDEEELEYALKVPLWKWLGLREEIAIPRAWTRVNGSVEGFRTVLVLRPWQRAERVVVYRKRVFHRTRKNFQLDLFSPDDGTYEYSAIATNKALSIPALWQFMAGRGGHEKTLAELKQQYGFDAIPTNTRAANEAWQMISVLALNLVRSFQIVLGAPRRPRSWKRTFAYMLTSLQTLRFELIQQPVRIVRPAGRPELRFAVSPRARRRLEHAQERLRRVA